MLKRLIFISVVVVVLTGFSFGSVDIHVRFENVDGLVAEDRVLFDGAGIGKVKKIIYGDDGHFLVSLSIEKEFKTFLTEYSRFIVTEAPRDNDRKAVEMLLTHMGGEPLKDGSSVEGSSKYEVLLEMMKNDARDGVEFLKREYQRFSNDLKSLSAVSYTHLRAHET